MPTDTPMSVTHTMVMSASSVLVSAAYSKSRKISQASHNLNWDRMSENGGWCDPANPAGVCFGQYPVGISYEQLRSTSIYHPRIPRLAQFAVENERLGVTSALQNTLTKGTARGFVDGACSTCTR